MSEQTHRLLYMCFCACHAESSILSFIPADLEDAISAATACDSCRDSHCLALLPTRLANDPQPERREKFEWIDGPQQPEPPQPPTVGDASGDDGN